MNKKTVDNDVYCAAIARRKNISVEEYRKTLDKENPYMDPTFIADKQDISTGEFSSAFPDVFEEH